MSTRSFLVLALLLAACDDKPKAVVADEASTTMATAEAGAAKPASSSMSVTVLVTSDENGYLLPADSQKKGGAAQLLGIWKADDQHRAGTDSPTLLLSTGDHWGGAAISSYFGGEPMADAMSKMGYAASAFGNHELNFGREQFEKDADKGGFPYLAANVTAKDDYAKKLHLEKWKIIERSGYKIGVIGLSDVNAPKTGMQGRFDFMDFAAYEDALAKAIPAVWEKGANALVVIADECPTVLGPILEKHADWKVSALAGGHCAQPMDGKAGNTPLVGPAKQLAGFARIKLTFDADKKLTGATAENVDASKSTVAPDADLTKMVDGFKKKIDENLGEQIGTTTTGLKVGSPEMVHWVAGAIRDNMKVDVALINKRGLRQDLPAGKITKASVYGVIPFENAVLTLKMKGADLKTALANPNVAADGPTGAIDPAKTYNVATLDYLYFGGDNLHLEKADPDPGETGRVWQTPVIEWTKKAATDDKKPLEKALPKP